MNPVYKEIFREDDSDATPIQRGLVEDLKEELLQKAAHRKNGSSGPIVVRAGGGTNPAIRQVT